MENGQEMWSNYLADVADEDALFATHNRQGQIDGFNQVLSPLLPDNPSNRV